LVMYSITYLTFGGIAHIVSSCCTISHSH
jgi:hypothetical protein